ncbi:hypothetical protein H4582DRAFT_2088712 [Lactarius indigo]|nr:hypothetical protein H4582DRAFT_2088712 [Lactarius indigo]
MDQHPPLTTAITADQLPVQWTFESDDKHTAPTPLHVEESRHTHPASAPSPSPTAAGPDELGRPIIAPDHGSTTKSRIQENTDINQDEGSPHANPEYFRRLWKVAGSMVETPIDLSNDEPILDGNDTTAGPYYITLNEVTTKEFELLLWVFYNPDYSHNEWEFPRVEALCWRELLNIGAFAHSPLQVPRDRSPRTNDGVHHLPRPQTVYAQLTTPNESEEIRRLYHPRAIHARPITSDQPEPKDNAMTAATHEPTPTIVAIATVLDTPRPSAANPTIGAPRSDAVSFHPSHPHYWSPLPDFTC